MGKKVTVAVLAMTVAALVTASSVLAFEGGGRKPSEAPLINWGQHYTGQLNNHKTDANYGGEEEVALWRLPPVSAHDTVTVNWHQLPYAHSSQFPICMKLIQGIEDFNWGEVFASSYSHYWNCSESGPNYAVSPSGTASNSITVQNPDATSTYLEFYTEASETEAADFETYPYDFTVEAPRHFLSLAVAPKSNVHANGVVKAAVTQADGLPAPDGLVFNLTVEWQNNGIATYTAATLGGQLAFVLALPESAYRERGTFLVSRPPDAAYQEVRGSSTRTSRRRSPAPPKSPAAGPVSTPTCSPVS